MKLKNIVIPANAGIQSILLVCLSICSLSQSFAQPTGAAFLKIPVTARSAGMGSAFTALVDDASALYGNPAGLGGVPGTDLLASHSEWIANTRESSFGLAQRIFGHQVLGVSYLALYTDPLDRRGEQGQNLGTFVVQDRAMGVTWAGRFFSRVSLGATVKTIEQHIDDVMAKGMAFDAGVQFHLHPRLSAGAVVQNWGRPMKFLNEPYALPTTYRAGLGIGLGQAFHLGFEARKEKGAPRAMDFAAGLEYRMTGLNRSYFWSPVVWRAGFLAPNAPGVGLGMKIFGSQVDYALSSMGSLGLTHRLSFEVKFGGRRSVNPAPEQLSRVSAPPVPVLAPVVTALSNATVSESTPTIAAPSSVIPAKAGIQNSDFQTVQLKSGMILTGFIKSVNSNFVEMETPDGLVTLKKSSIQRIDYQTKTSEPSAPTQAAAAPAQDKPSSAGSAQNDKKSTDAAPKGTGTIIDFLLFRSR